MKKQCSPKSCQHLFSPAAIITLLFILVLPESVLAVPDNRTSSDISIFDLPAGSAPAIVNMLSKDLPAGYQPEQTDDGIVMVNPSHNMSVLFTHDGPQVNIADNHWTMRLTGIGYGGIITPVERTTPTQKDNHIEYQRDNFTEWYINSWWGLEQGFTIYDSSEKSSGPLTIRIALSGTLIPRIDSGAIILSDNAHNDVIKYAGLSVYDATHQQLPAEIKLDGSTLSILVDETYATYPVTIDPWIQAAKLKPIDGEAGDNFGYTVAINNRGDTIVIGAYGDDHGSGSSGSAYVFERSQFGDMNKVAKLTASDGESGNEFGKSVAIDEDTIVVGSPGWQTYHGVTRGAVYVFEKPGNGWENMYETAKLHLEVTGDDNGETRLGHVVAIRGDLIVAGKPSVDNGSAHIFLKPSSSWEEMTASNCKLFARQFNPPFSDFTSYGENFGVDVDIGSYWSDDLNKTIEYVVVGANKKWAHETDIDKKGKVFYFGKPVGGWVGEYESDQFVAASDGSDYNLFGSSLAVDGRYLIVGAPGSVHNGIKSGRAYIFNLTSLSEEGWIIPVERQENARFGHDVSINEFENVIASAPYEDNFGADSGKVYLYEWPSEGWANKRLQDVTIISDEGSEGDFFGLAVDVSPGGPDTIVIGSPGDDDNGENSGATYLFEFEAYPDPPFDCWEQDDLTISECYNLQEFYYSTNGDNWSDNSGWMTNNDPCTSWTGISCEEIYECYMVGLNQVCSFISHVSEISLISNQLSGKIPESIGYFEYLSYLNLRDNQLTGPIPSTMSLLENLAFLSLAECQLIGPIPASLGDLENLTNLYLGNNNLQYSIPQEIGNLVNLQYFEVAGNSLSGTLTDRLGDLQNLIYLKLDNNQLNGSIPATIGNLTELQYLNMSDNFLNGPLPDSLGNLTKLVHFDIGNNQFTGLVSYPIAQVGDDAGYCDFSENQLCMPDADIYVDLGGDSVCNVPFTNDCTNVCGDGLLTVLEECDDGGQENDDGCSAVCTIESDWGCSGNPSTCEPLCVSTGIEYCDDGNACTDDHCAPQTGCYYTVNEIACGSLQITEVMYNPDGLDKEWEWIELFNSGSNPIDLTGFVIDDDDGLSHPGANIGPGSIPPGGTAILYSAELQEDEFVNGWGASINLIPVYYWDAMELDDTGDKIGIWGSLTDYNGDHETHSKAAVEFDYGSESPWPLAQRGHSIYLNSIEGDNSLATSWTISLNGIQTPMGMTMTSTRGDTGSPARLFGDINGDARIDLKDIITGLRILSNDSTDVVNLGAEIDQDGTIGMVEILYVFNYLSNELDVDEDGYSVNQLDCDDYSSNINPGEIDICEDGIDQDCNGVDCYCGDGHIDPQAGETCDDGNNIDTDECSNQCRNAVCGDFITWTGHEECDDGGESSTCDSDCTAVVCGDGMVNSTAGESCDDNNHDSTDGCLANCTEASCGDGFLWTGQEECDDGNFSDFDGCNSICVVEFCGDGVPWPGQEECDDIGESAECNTNCTISSCGDHILNVTAGEECDDGNSIETDSCLSNCTSAFCGDGFVREGLEECDDGNYDNTDTCTNNCTMAICGDGIVWEGYEECDDGNQIDRDGCRNNCTTTI